MLKFDNVFPSLSLTITISLTLCFVHWQPNQSIHWWLEDKMEWHPEGSNTILNGNTKHWKHQTTKMCRQNVLKVATLSCDANACLLNVLLQFFTVWNIKISIGSASKHFKFNCPGCLLHTQIQTYLNAATLATHCIQNPIQDHLNGL